MSITISQLVTFLAVARTGSIKAAAAERVVSQPSISASIAALSASLGVRLTERVGRGVRLTPSGRALLPFVVDILGLLEQARAAAREATEVTHRRIRIAAVTAAGEYLVPALIRGFTDEHPEIDIDLRVGNQARVFELALSREADVVIGGRPPLDGRLVGDAFAANQFTLITSVGDPLVRRTDASLEDLENRTWLIREAGSGTRRLVEDVLMSRDLHPRLLTMGSNGAIKHAVRYGMGVSIQSTISVELELSAGVLGEVRLREPLPERHWFLLRPQRGPRRGVVDTFAEFVATRGPYVTAANASR
ncbi:MAG: LysR family transcriptional regulator [Chloroflexi bacterium]|nr:LysR family transcriptional regulator [Chloroflexota bacterium]